MAPLHRTGVCYYGGEISSSEAMATEQNAASPVRLACRVRVWCNESRGSKARQGRRGMRGMRGMMRRLQSDSARFFAWHARARQAVGVHRRMSGGHLSPLRTNGQVTRRQAVRGGPRIFLGVLAALGLMMALSLLIATAVLEDGAPVGIVNFNRSG